MYRRLLKIIISIREKRLTPNDYTVKRLGIIALMNGNYEDTISNLTECYKSNPDDAIALFNLAKVYYVKRDFNKSKNYITQCLKIRPDYPGADELILQISDSVKMNSNQ